jgi:hypothetical protein
VTNLRDALSGERAALAAVAQEAAERGPLHALRRITTGEAGGPLLQRGLLILAFLGLAPLSILSTPFGFWLFVLAGPPLVTAALLFLDSKSLDATDSSYVAVFPLVLLMLLGLPAIYVLFSMALRRKRAAVLRRFGRWSYGDVIWWSALVIAIPAVTFGVISASLVHWGWLGVDGVAPSDPNLPYKAFETYVWNLADAIPLLKVPETLNWEPSLRFPTFWGGALVLAYKVLVILPFAQLLAIALSRVFGEAEEGETP